MDKESIRAEWSHYSTATIEMGIRGHCYSCLPDTTEECDALSVEFSLKNISTSGRIFSQGQTAVTGNCLTMSSFPLHYNITVA